MDLHRAPPVPERPFDILARKMDGEEGASAVLADVSSQMGLDLQQELTGFVHDQVLAAIVLIRGGMSIESVSSSLTWREFEGFCAGVLRACGYLVRTNIVITKPRRQIDIFAESQTLALSVDCKHWAKTFSGPTLERVASSQTERTARYKRKAKIRSPVLPVVLTLLASPVKQVQGVPIVPVFALRDFALAVSRFDEGLVII